MEQEHAVTFLPANRTARLPEGLSLIKAARALGLHINSSCGGAGVCGKCRVKIEQGQVEGGTSEKLSAADLAAGYRQACTALVAGEVTVRIPVESGASGGAFSTVAPERQRARMHLFDLEALRQEGLFEPPVEKLCLELTPPSPADNRADAGRMIQGLAEQYGLRQVAVNLPVLRRLGRVMRERNFLITVTVARSVNGKFRNQIVNVQPGCWSGRNFGLAIDIGTTTIYGQLLDMHSGAILAEEGDYNPQISYGEDVISRIVFAEKAPGLATMNELVVAAINNLIHRLLARPLPPSPGLSETPIGREEINSVTVAGNTTMTHLFLGLEPAQIRRAPYVPVSTFFPPLRATDLGLDLPPHALALVYPSVSSYVGGDIVAGVMGSGMYRTGLLTLYIDIGTNAEIVIGNREWLVCAACSAGPAFEGGGITHGMRAARGAIEDFSLNPETWEPMNITIGDRPPIGICGSGLLIIVAALFRHGALNQAGRFNPIDTPRLRQGKNGMEFVLAWEADAGVEHDIVINEVDIDNFIRAKAAIFAGAKTLIEEVGLAVADLEQIILAGAFGSYIDLDAAMTVGLLPEVAPEKVLYVGNGSLMGARMSELSNHIRRDVVEVVRKLTSFELSEVRHFKDQYVASLFLPHTDSSLFPRVNKWLKP
ncbi:MAG: ASKHA domain-containing protein [Desulfobacteraceae bacterium]|nr:ASKHA domain-containing protein [Desulfobacteraceae bacterium]